MKKLYGLLYHIHPSLGNCHLRRSPAPNFQRIYNPVDTDLFRPAEDRNAIRAGLGIPPGAFVIACGATGLFNPVKGGHFIPLVLE